MNDLSLEERLEVGIGMKEGQRKIDEAVANVGKEVNGWRISSLPGDGAHYNGDWLKRAVAAQAGIYGNDAAEAMYPLTHADSQRQTTRRQQAQLYADVPARPTSARELLLVANHL